jgi:hypothetical protein
MQYGCIFITPYLKELFILLSSINSIQGSLICMILVQTYKTHFLNILICITPFSDLKCISYESYNFFQILQIQEKILKI